MKKLLLILLPLLLISCSSNHHLITPTSIEISISSTIDTSEQEQISSENDNVGGDHLQTDWEW